MDIGIIAEDQSDVDVMYELTKKLVETKLFSFKKYLGFGCGKLRHKCSAWAKNLLSRGCNHLIVLHDLDKNNEKELDEELNNYVWDVGFKRYVILIPIHEIEAWLLADPEAIKMALNLSSIPNAPKQPESIRDPKERLRDIVWKTDKKRYIHTVHNKRIAVHIEVKRLNKCRSFQRYPKFIKEIFNN